MSDLFSNGSRPRIADDYLTPAQELELWSTDRPAWLKRVAPNAAMRLVRGGEEAIRLSWPHMRADYKTAVWLLLDLDGRKLVRRALDGKAATTNLDLVPA